MNERLLQYIWQFQYFNKTELVTTEGEPLRIIHTGTYNTNQGPDFLDAKIQIGNTVWAGSIELHINTGDWNRHNHDLDKNYKNVILHVVWKDDVELRNNIPVFVLEERVSKLLLKYYEGLMNTDSFISCEKSITATGELHWLSWKERLLVERLQKKAVVVFKYLAENRNHWEETFWWMIAGNFGIKINSETFDAIARSLPINVLAKHKNQLHQVESLLFGQAGLLDGEFTEDYPALLQKEYRFLQLKYKLKKIHAPVYFLRMRPANFPTVRLAQLAMLIHTSLHLFASIKESRDVQTVRALLNVTANDYWHYHYRFDEATGFKEKNLGESMINNILINTVVPILFAYGSYHQEEVYKEKALQWLNEITAEKNNITKGYTALKIENRTAFDSQALIQLKHEYCDKKRCLDCAVGNRLLKGSQ